MTNISHNVQETGQDLEAFMSTWVEQVGYPVVTINTQTGETTQEQFLLKQEAGHEWVPKIKWLFALVYSIIISTESFMHHAFYRIGF